MPSVLKLDTIKSTTGNEALTIHESGVPLLNVPAFHVTRITSVQNVTSSTTTKIEFNSTVFDTNSFWDGSNFRYTPQIAGYYYFFSTVYCQGTGITSIESFLYKNGSVAVSGPFIVSSSQNNLITAPVQSVIYLNGTSDYVEAYGFSNGTSPRFLNDAATLFSGYLVRAA